MPDLCLCVEAGIENELDERPHLTWNWIDAIANLDEKEVFIVENLNGVHIMTSTMLIQTL